MKKSITIIGKRVEHAYVIKDVHIDEVTIEKYNVECKKDIQSAWGDEQDQVMSTEGNRQTLEVILQDKISTTTLKARPNVIEIAARSGGQIIKDIVTERAKRGKTVYISNIIFFENAFRTEDTTAKENI